MKVSALHVYPVKSCRGVALERADVVDRGLALDRRWMVVDERGMFVTARTEPRLATVATALVADTIEVSADGHGAVRLPATTKAGRRVSVKVWNSEVDALVHMEGGAFFSEFLGRAVRAVHMPDDVRRPVNPKRARPGDVVSFADGYPLLLVGGASLRDLNERLDQDIGMDRFRPNVVVEGAAPYAEDEWSKLRLGAVSFRAPKRCVRCTLTTVDPATGDKGKEPLRALATYRREDGNVYFGTNLIQDDAGALRVGDAVEVLERR